MNKLSSTEIVEGQTSAAPRNSLDVLIVVLRWRKFILVFILAATLLAAIVSLLLPKWYKSSASLLPPKNQNLIGGLSGLSALIKEVAPTASGKLGGQGSNYNYLAILKSRRAAENVIRHFNLIGVYDISDSSMEKAIDEFNENYNVGVTDEGTITIEINDRDSVRAAAMTNYMVGLLNKISIELGTGEARNNREFLEKRVNDNRNDLAIAEEKFKKFQERNGMVILPDDAQAMAASVASLYGNKVKLEMELAILKKTIGVENQEYRQRELEKNELEKKLSGFPELGMESFRLYRDVLIQQRIMEFLVPLYEQAKIEEQKDIPVMVVLDKATPAEKKSRPRRLLIVTSSFFSSCILSVLLVLLIERYRNFKIRYPHRYELLRSMLRIRNSDGPV